METQQHTSRLEDTKEWLSCKVGQIKPAIRKNQMKLQQQLRNRPAMWAGIAAGVGFALGLAGRIARHRRLRREMEMVILEAC